PPPGNTSSNRTEQFDWGVFVAELPRPLQIVRAILAELPPPRIEGHRVAIVCHDTAAYDALQLKREQLERFLAKKLGHSVELFIEQSTESIAPNDFRQAQPSQPNTGTQSSNNELTPLERILTEQLGAKRIPLL
ncbi:MAG: hypothetical protein N2663_09285, partial [Chlorobi bacterium]|nr:hypothetical protein [Chlorobiota bacterium]